jgi:hypothetical protein
MVADHPVYPIPTQFFGCWRVSFVEVDLDKVPGLCGLSIWLVREKA